MHRWLIPLACWVAGLSAFAQVPDPGVISDSGGDGALPQPAIRHAGGDLIADATSSSSIASVTAPDNSLAPPPDKPAPKQDASVVDKPAPAPAATFTPPPAPPDKTPGASVLPTSIVHTDDGRIRDTVGHVPDHAAPDVKEDTMECFKQVDFLRKHNDPTMAVSYLRKILANGKLLPQDRARAILELADCLGLQHQEAEALCWLKLWSELYPARPEIGAVAFRIGTLYTQMGLSDLARDAYYLALAHTVNQGQVQNAADLKNYTRLTVGTLWALAAHEYQGGQWARAAELFDRYRKEATTGSPLSMEKAAYLQADCYYQSRQTDDALNLYDEMLTKHPFNPLAPQARLRLYHLYVMKKEPEKAQNELQALIWTVRTVWPKDEAYWQKQTAQFLLALNEKNIDVLPPLLQKSSLLPPQGKTWQEALNHYDALVAYQAAATHTIMDQSVQTPGKAEARPSLVEENNLLAMNSYMNQLLPPPRTASTH
jgi:tetratricopeptide (TPR) repeat protein